MKTAEEEIAYLEKSISFFDINENNRPFIIKAMKMYAKSVAEQALKDAAERCKSRIHNQTILSTPIITL